MRRVRLALVGLLVAAFSLGFEVARWGRGAIPPTTCWTGQLCSSLWCSLASLLPMGDET
jgi:hypothetical protein